MIGILVEKQSASRNFAKALGGMTGTYNGEAFKIAVARGHLYEYKPKLEVHVPPMLARRYKSWELSDLPWDLDDIHWKRTPKTDAAATLKDIKAVLSTCDEIVIATDIDPSGEGDLLAWEIIEELKLHPKKFSRMEFIDEMPRSLQTAFVQRRPVRAMMSEPDYLKAEYRNKFDFMSMQFTRVATKCGDGSAVLRQGRLKSAMVLLVGDGLKALAGYKKVPFYQNRFRDENGVSYSNPNEPMFPTKDQVPMQYAPSSVVVDSKTMKSTAPPKLMDLAGLSALLSRKGVKTKEVLSTYQKMYEAQIVSYPRTEDKHVTDEQFKELLPFVDRIATVVGIDPKILTHRQPRSTHVHSGGAHGANRPGVNVPGALSDLRVHGSCAPMIYEILARNYLAILAEDYEYESQKGHVQAYPDFTGNVSVPKRQGWKVVFASTDDDPDVSDKGLGTRAEPYVHEGFPPKPPTPTMEWLMAQLDKHDVGTGSTKASIYSEVTDSTAKYPLMLDVKGKLIMTEYGEMSYRLLPGTHIGDLSLTEELQANMRAIAAGKTTAEACLARVADYVRADIVAMAANGAIMRKELGIVMSTGVSDKEYSEGTWCGQQIKFNRVFRGHRFSDDECRRLLAGEEISVLDLVSAKTNKTYGVIGKLTNQVYNNHNFVGFEQTGFADREGIPEQWCQHVFTADEKIMLEDGRPVKITDAVSKKTGKTFSCTLTYGVTDKGTKGLIPSFDR